MQYDCKDLGLADAGKKRIEWADENMPVLPVDTGAFREGTAARGREDRGVPPRDDGDGEPRLDAARPAAPGSRSAPRTR